MNSEQQKATEMLLVKQLETMTDSQFLGFFAMMTDRDDSPLARYSARRLDMIALHLGADEAKGEEA